ncbi:class I SAM-dependent methyltransferase [Candidatus Woesearchaeota archaeon]|nr:class I SAM-dependent methyltransferase [Candidatus Woesearchaeota archaeon]
MDFYKIISAGYDGLYGEEQKIKIEIIRRNFNINNNDILLDVGCGTGLSSDFSCKVVGIDPSISLIRQNNNKNKILAIAENMPFKDNSFDKVISITSMHNFEGIEKSIREIKRVGKRDFAFSILKKSGKFDLIEKEIQNNFIVKKMLDGKKDWIFICKA